MESNSGYQSKVAEAKSSFNSGKYKETITICRSVLNPFYRMDQCNISELYHKPGQYELAYSLDQLQGLLQKSEQKLAEDKARAIEQYQAQIETYLTSPPNISFSDLVLSDSLLNYIKQNILLKVNFMHLISNQQQESIPNKFLFYGFPGTGKTITARVIANMAKVTYFQIPREILFSSEEEPIEKLQQMFNKAKVLKPSIIFFNDIDDLLVPPFNQELPQKQKEIVQALCTELERLDEMCVFISEAHTPMNYDKDVFNHLGVHVFFDLPTEELRLQFLKSTLMSELACPESELEMVAEKTSRYSFSDLKIFCQEAIMSQIRALRTSKLFKKNEEGKYEPTDNLDPEGEEIDFERTNPDLFITPKVDKNSLEEALAKVKPCTDCDLFARFQYFNEGFREV